MPITPIGINLPNSNWIRAQYGSKSVTIENITDAYDEVANGTGFNDEFAYSNVEVELMKKYLTLADKLHTDLQPMPKAKPLTFSGSYPLSFSTIG